METLELRIKSVIDSYNAEYRMNWDDKNILVLSIRIADFISHAKCECDSVGQTKEWVCNLCNLPYEIEERETPKIETSMDDLTRQDRNWTEDYPHENGNYVNKCIECGGWFNGHKRRVQCKLCATRPVFTKEEWQRITEIKPPTEAMRGAYQGCWAEGEMVGFARCMIKHVFPLKESLRYSADELRTIAIEYANWFSNEESTNSFDDWFKTRNPELYT